MILAPTLTLSAGSGAAIVRPTFSRDFAGEKTLNNGTGPAITFTRASNATFFNASGVLQTASNDVPRFDHDPATGASRGLLIEEARTNSIRNSQAGGSTNGVIGSGGALPTNWSASGHNTNGVSTEIVGTGAENGLSYIDIKVSGTPTSTSAAFFNFEPSTQIVAANGQSWIASMYCKLVNGSLANTSVFLTVSGRAADGSNISGQATNQSVPTTSSALASQRYTSAITFSSASVARVLPFFYVNYTSGNPIDLTLRIAAPQLEQGAFPTSYIPTTTAAATRSADSAVVTPISGFYNGTEGTIFSEFSVPRLDGTSTLRGIAQFAEAGAVQNRLQNGVRGNGAFHFSAQAANVSEFANDTGTGAVAAGAIVKTASAYKSSESGRSINGIAASAISGALTQPTREVLRFGDVSTNGAAVLNGHIRKIAYYPRRLSNTLLQQLTT